MSTRKTTLFYGVLIALASVAVGMVIASQWGLPQASSAQAINVPASNTAPLNGAIDAQTFRNIAKAQNPVVVNIQTTARARGRELTDFFGGDEDLLQRFFGGQRPRGPADAPPERGAAAAGHRHRLHHRQVRVHPDQQPRGRGGGGHPGQPLWRRPHRELRGQGDRARLADRHGAHPAHRDARRRAAGGAVRRFGADAAGRLGRRHRQPVRPQPHHHRRGHLRPRPAVRRRARA